jgi:hypothetical protein
MTLLPGACPIARGSCRALSLSIRCNSPAKLIATF